MIPADRKPTHPGEMLLHEFLKPMKLTQMELASRMGVPVQRINTLINGKRDMTAETAILLSRVLKTTPEFWMNLQDVCDLYEAQLRLSPIIYKHELAIDALRKRVALPPLTEKTLRRANTKGRP